MQQFLRSAYAKFLAPRQKDKNIRNRELVLNALLAGTLAILALALSVIIVNYQRGLTFLEPRAIALSLVFLVVIGIYLLSRRGRYRLAAWLLVIVYVGLAAAVGLIWSIALPSAGLLYGLVVVLAGILLGPRYSLVGTLVVLILIIGTFILQSCSLITHDLAWKKNSPGPDDVFGLSFMLGIIAVVSWLFNYQMARSLRRAEKAEAALLKQKALLETTVEERTRELQTAQLEKVQQMYRFAELGQLSTALMHELANHLTSLTLDIEGLQGQGRSRAVNRAKRSIRYIDDMVVRVREQLHGKIRTRPFNAVNEVDAVVTMLRHKAQTARVQLKWQPPANAKKLRVTGEPVRLRQLMANLISNAIDAYYEPREGIDERRDVEVRIESDELYIIISVNDWGRGVPEEHVDKLFEPFFSTKETGMGMGLYIAKQVVIEHFLGDIKLVSPTNPTNFVITLPKA